MFAACYFMVYGDRVMAHVIFILFLIFRHRPAKREQLKSCKHVLLKMLKLFMPCVIHYLFFLIFRHRPAKREQLKTLQACVVEHALTLYTMRYTLLM